MDEVKTNMDRTEAMTRIFRLLYGNKLRITEVFTRPGFKELMLDRTFQAKRELYHQLLLKNESEITPQEVNIAYELSKDTQIQKYLDYMLGRI
jgi:hypothetical protein